jgi:dipeptidyl aminopeptidase/acylaminoacyl peptidase
MKMRGKMTRIFFITGLLAALAGLSIGGGLAIAADDSVTTPDQTTLWLTGNSSDPLGGVWAYPVSHPHGAGFQAYPNDLTPPVNAISGERIVFTLNGQVSTMDTDGGNLSVLTNGTHPLLSPDGSKIAFIRHTAQGPNLSVMNSDGANIVSLTSDTSFKTLDGWSPDSSKIIFTAWGQNYYEIVTIGTDGSAKTQIADGNSQVPDWSPNGAKIVYEHLGRIWTMNPDGSGKVQITNTGWNRNPRWSPDSSQVVFESNRNGNMEIYVMAADGSNQTRLTNNTSRDSYPRWSPDGTKITFSSTRDGNWQIYVMSAGGADQTRLTHSSSYDYLPRWLLNGTDIIFNSISTSKQIHRVSIVGGGEVNLTNNTGRNELHCSQLSLELPCGETKPATNITSTGATLSGNLTDMVGENPLKVLFVYSTAQFETFPDGSGIMTPDITLTAPGEFHYDLTGLLPNTTYYFRAWSKSITEILCSTVELSFTTGSSSSLADINIRVTLQGGSRPDAGWVVPLTVKLFTPGTSTPVNVLTAAPVYTFNPTTLRNGTNAVAQISGVTPGTYDISVVSPGCLTNVRRGVIISAVANDISLGTLLAGNANDDNKINIQDFGVLAASYARGVGETGYDARADFDRSGRINIADFGLLAASYAKNAPVAVP